MDTQTPSGSLPRAAMIRNASLAVATEVELASELLSRLSNATEFGSLVQSEQALLVESDLVDALEVRLDVTMNRFAVALAAEQFGFTRHCWQTHGMPMVNAFHVELGCGSHNPLGRLFANLMLGAAGGIAIDLDSPLRPDKAVRHLARLASVALLDPQRLFPQVEITPQRILENLAGLDLPRIAAGNVTGLHDRLTFSQRSVLDTGLPDHRADVLFSNSLLEHLPDVPMALREWARVTVRGGYGVHVIDVSDHRFYSDPKVHPLEFLTVNDQAPIVYASNRLRVSQYSSLFNAAGFDVVEYEQLGLVPVSESLRARLVMPWREMSDTDVGHLYGRFLVRKR